MRYIGVAVGEFITRNARALTTINAKDGIPNVEEIEKIFNEWTPKEIVVGIPINLNGEKQQITLCAEKFANRLAHKYKVVVHRVDEQFSTLEAKKMFKVDTSNKQDLKKLNSISAQIILQRWFDQH